MVIILIVLIISCSNLKYVARKVLKDVIGMEVCISKDDLLCFSKLAENTCDIVRYVLLCCSFLICGAHFSGQN